MFIAKKNQRVLRYVCWSNFQNPIWVPTVQIPIELDGKWLKTMIFTQNPTKWIHWEEKPFVFALWLALRKIMLWKIMGCSQKFRGFFQRRRTFCGRGSILSPLMILRSSPPKNKHRAFTAKRQMILSVTLNQTKKSAKNELDLIYFNKIGIGV